MVLLSSGLTTDHHCTMRELFGGAVGCAIPDNFMDVSGFRQVPDNQEVYADPQSDHSVIVEILEYVSSEQLAGMAPARYFFNDIAEANGAVAGSVRVLTLRQQHTKRPMSTCVAQAAWAAQTSAPAA